MIPFLAFPQSRAEHKRPVHAGVVVKIPWVHGRRASGERRPYWLEHSRRKTPPWFALADPWVTQHVTIGDLFSLVQFGAMTRDWYSLYANAMAGMDAPFGELAGRHPPVRVNAALPLASYTGTYANNHFGPIFIEDRAGKLLLTIGPQSREYTLRHWDKNKFVFPISTQYEPPGSVSSADFTMDDTGTSKSLMIEFLNRNGQGTFARQEK